MGERTNSLGGNKVKSVLISIQPKWVDKIVSGKKTIEVRKTRPKLEAPFKCYIYCTKGKPTIFESDGLVNGDIPYFYNGYVMGEFVCDRIICSQAYFDSQGKNHLTNIFEEDIKRTCLTEYELWNYIAGKAVKANQMYDGYLWHISDLKIYDEPKELGEFKRPREICDTTCRVETRNCDGVYESDFGKGFCPARITRPPQSWCYVESGGVV